MLDQGTIYELHTRNTFRSPWLVNVENILNLCGMTTVWQCQFQGINPQWLKRAVNNRLQEQFIQQNETIMSNNSKCFLYKEMKADHKFEEYLVKIPKIFSVPILKLRSCNHQLPIERGRYSNIPRERRYCELCDDNRPFVGDEYRFFASV